MTVHESPSLSGFHFVYKMKRLPNSENLCPPPCPDLTFVEEATEYREREHGPKRKADSVLALNLPGPEHPHLYNGTTVVSTRRERIGIKRRHSRSKLSCDGSGAAIITSHAGCEPSLPGLTAPHLPQAS